MSRPSDDFTFDELRDEFDWMFEFQSRMAERIRGDADVHSEVDYVGKLERENANLREENERLRSVVSDGADNAREILAESRKLRELCGFMLRCISQYHDCADCLVNGEHCEISYIESDARELGIEVDA